MNYESLSGNYVLLDTNVLINYSRYAKLVDKVFDSLRNNKITPVLDEMVRFEFMRDAASIAETEILREYLKVAFNLDDKEVDVFYSQPTNEIIRYATEIANLYSWKLKNAKISLVDCFLAARMRKFNEKKDRLFLATSDHTDFPQLFFERMGIETIDLGESILNIGFYRFDQTKFATLQSEYQSQR